MTTSTSTSQVQTAHTLPQRDQALIKKHQDYILQLVSFNNDPVAISICLQKHEIDIRVSTLRSFLQHHYE